MRGRAFALLATAINAVAAQTPGNASDAQNLTSGNRPRVSITKMLSDMGVAPFATGAAVTYDPNTPPNNNYATPVNAEMQYVLIDVMSIDEKTGEIELTQQTEIEWDDTRLAYSESTYPGIRSLRLQSSQVKIDLKQTFWVPNFNTMFFQGIKMSTEKIIITSKEQMERGKVWKQRHMKWELTYNVKFRNTPSMRHEWFPFDVMRIHWRAMVSEYAFCGANKIEMVNFALTKCVIPPIESARYNIYSDEKANSMHDALRITTRSGNIKTVIGVDITISRYLFGYFAKNILPLAMCVYTSTASFWISPQAVPARTGFGVTMLLVGISQQQQLVSELPKISYLTWMDYYGYICFCYLVANLLLFAFVHSRLTLADKDKDRAKNLIDTAVNTDVRARLIMPLSFTIILVSFISAGAIFSKNQLLAPMDPLVPDDPS